MPNFENKLYRLFCTSCQDFTLHTLVYKDETDHQDYKYLKFEGEDQDHASRCKCGKQYETILVRDIPKDKLIEQRERFKAFRSKQLKEGLNIFSMLGMGTTSSSFFNSVEGPKTRIIESDAGLEQEEKIIQDRKKEQRRLLKLEIEKFKDVQRNDTCLCGSGLKYKKCCIVKHQ